MYDPYNTKSDYGYIPEFTKYEVNPLIVLEYHYYPNQYNNISNPITDRGIFDSNCILVYNTVVN